jgi:hypothetical protein
VKRYDDLKQECLTLLRNNAATTFEIDDCTIFSFLLSDYCNVYQMYEISVEIQLKHKLEFKENALFFNGYNNASKIVKAVTLYLNNDKKKSKKVFDNIHLQNINFDFKKYFSIQYHLLALGFCSKNATAKRTKIKHIISHLIEETGLVYFNNLMKLFE